MWRRASLATRERHLDGMPLEVLGERVANHVALLTLLRFTESGQSNVHRLWQPKGAERRAVPRCARAVERSSSTDRPRHILAATQCGLKQRAASRGGSRAALKSCFRRERGEPLCPVASFVSLGHLFLRLSTRASVVRRASITWRMETRAGGETSTITSSVCLLSLVVPM